MSTYGFPKAEHITLKRDIEAIFAAGTHSTAAFPLRAVWHSTEWDGHSPRVKVMVSVSKRKFKHAVDRNRAKRQMREAYRLNKHILTDAQDIPHDKALHVAFIWTSDTEQPTSLIMQKTQTLLRRNSEKQQQRH